jgi:AcrR family transcriptional regulator
VRERLIAVARELFTRRGFDGVSVREISARARANLGAITYHFGSKEALYHAAIESVIEPFAERLTAAADSRGRAIDRIEAVVRAALDHQPSKAGVPALLLRELAGDGPLPPPMVRLFRRTVTLSADLIREGQRDRSVRAGDPILLALSVIAQPFYVKVAGRSLAEGLGISPSDATTWTQVVDHVALSVRRTVATLPSLR